MSLGPDTREPIDTEACVPELRGHPHEHRVWCVDPTVGYRLLMDATGTDYVIRVTRDDLDPTLRVPPPPDPTIGSLLLTVLGVLGVIALLFGAWVVTR